MWRNTGILPRFFFFDARSFIMILPFLFHMSKLTFIFSCISIFFFALIERLGISPDIALRMVRTKIIGPIRPSATDTKIFRTRCWYW